MYLQRHIDLEDAIYNFIRPHSALKVKLRQPAAHGRRWQQRTPAIAAGLTDHIWSLEELLSYCSPPLSGKQYYSRLTYTAPALATTAVARAADTLTLAPPVCPPLRWYDLCFLG